MVSGELHASRGGRAVRTSIGSDGGMWRPLGVVASGHPACVRAVCARAVLWLDVSGAGFGEADVLYDKPSSVFQPTSVDERHTLFERLAAEYTELARTSEDEDFSVLLDALKQYDVRKEAGDSGLPDLFCIITGKGPQKAYYLSLIHNSPLAHVKFLTPWLSAQDYPKMLGSADLGVCLHTSSSKLDLPMKVVDMFGCGLPVCAVDYPCLRELVKPGETGLVFESSEELCQHICDLLQGFPKPTKLLESLRANVDKWQASTLG
ncbi:hypothetical protein HPB50_010771 [Hyalomma asiaticum]|uniref:Uncharacterized protein n=1 Tax=Hyalomma asiaticum TaxID=266040 RepID=A0ACB7T9I4_HYAAI|nr:hypothetical protein HPB50_010771 [Hyalomma asiaticum]